VFRVFRGAEKSRGTGSVVLETWYLKMGLAGSYPLASFNATSQIG
jgi:hypothetical protein